MAGVGDAKARKYVIDELIRRTAGLSAKRRLPNSKVEGDIEALNTWHNLKTPWIRMVSNAVPKTEATSGVPSTGYAEYEETVELFGGADPDNSTRFSHALFGGVGQIQRADSTGVDYGLARNFEQNYINPFLYANDNETRGVKAEENRLRPGPGITALDVTFKGDMGALKKAVVNFKCHTLADLERMEKLYMYPGIKVLVEWGWSCNTAGTDFQSQKITGVPYTDDVLKNPAKVYAAIQEQKKLSGGTYDAIFGTIVNFSWNINKDKSFDCQTTVSDIGDSIFTANVNTPFHAKFMDGIEDDGQVDGGFTLSTALSVVQKKLQSKGDTNTIEDFEIPFTKSIGPLKGKFFRIYNGDTSKASEDNKKHRNKKLYIRFGDIVDRLCNKLYCLTSEHTRAEATNTSQVVPAIAMLSIGGTQDQMDTGLSDASPATATNPEDEDDSNAGDTILKPISCITNHKNLLSCDPNVCLLPNQIGTNNEYDVLGAKTTRVKKYVPTGLAGSGCDFNIPKELGTSIAGREYTRAGEFGAGFLANIFVEINVLQEAAESANSLGDFLNACTAAINKACADVWAFQWRMSDDHPGYMTCIDRNFSWSGKVEALEFGVDNLSSLVKSLSMKSSISSQMVNHLYIAANSPFTGAEVKKGELSNKNIIPLDVDFEIDGISGLQFGTTLAIDYLPKRYRAQTYLFAKQIQHSITPNNWATTITAGFRWAPLEQELMKIKLGLIPGLIPDVGITPDDLYTKLIEEESDKGKGEKFEKTGTGSTTDGKYPGSMFESLESQGLTMGGDGLDPNLGTEVATDKNKQEALEDLIERMSRLMGTIYYTGGTIDEINDANSTLNKIIYYSLADGTPDPKSEKAAAAKPITQKVIKSRSTQQYDPIKIGLGTSNTDIDSSGRQTRDAQGYQVPLGPEDMF